MVWYYLIRRTHRHTHIHTHRHAGDLESFIHFTQTDWQSGQASGGGQERRGGGQLGGILGQALSARNTPKKNNN